MNTLNGTEQQQPAKVSAAQLVNGATSKGPQQEQSTTTLIPLEVLSPAAQHLVIDRAPEVVLIEAQKAAAALKDVIGRKPKPVIFNGEQYLEFEDWQTVGRFYGVTAKVRESRYVEFGDVRGFEATADVLQVSTGQIISSAESMCLNDEEKWNVRPKYEGYGNRRRQVGYEPVPLFQLRSMAQTRACAKAFRTVLSWVVVLAGYRPTPAEEMDGVPGFDGCPAPPPGSDPRGYNVDIGNAPYGSREAAAAVRDRKLAEIATQPKPAASEKPWRSFGGMRESFRVARERVGEVIWNQVLDEYPNLCGDPARFKSTEDALIAYNKMLRLAAETEAAS